MRAAVLVFVCAAASGPYHDGADVQEHHATRAHQLHTQLLEGRCHFVSNYIYIYILLNIEPAMSVCLPAVCDQSVCVSASCV